MFGFFCLFVFSELVLKQETFSRVKIFKQKIATSLLLAFGHDLSPLD